jgi:hypothetical protein
VSDPVLVFVNDRAVRIAPGARAIEAVELHDPALAGPLRTGGAYLTDARGIRLAPDEPVHAGLILRVVVSARAAGGGADAHA